MPQGVPRRRAPRRRPKGENDDAPDDQPAAAPYVHPYAPVEEPEPDAGDNDELRNQYAGIDSDEEDGLDMDNVDMSKSGRSPGGESEGGARGGGECCRRMGGGGRARWQRQGGRERGADPTRTGPTRCRAFGTAAKSRVHFPLSPAPLAYRSFLPLIPPPLPPPPLPPPPLPPLAADGIMRSRAKPKKSGVKWMHIAFLVLLMGSGEL